MCPCRISSRWIHRHSSSYSNDFKGSQVVSLRARVLFNAARMWPIRRASSIQESALRKPVQTSTSSPGPPSTALTITRTCRSLCKRPLPWPQPRSTKKDRVAIWLIRRWPMASRWLKTMLMGLSHPRTFLRTSQASSSVLGTRAFSASMWISKQRWWHRAATYPLRLAWTALLTCNRNLTPSRWIKAN